MRSRWVIPALVALAACTVPTPRRAPSPPARLSDGPPIRVELIATAPRATISAAGAWRIGDGTESSTLVRAAAGESWTIARDGSALVAVRADGARSEARPGPFIVSSAEDGVLLAANGRRYRGELVAVARDSGIALINRLPLEQYLRGVVPLEIGRRVAGERAAVEAQAIAARSYAAQRLRDRRPREHDIRASVMDQVYGGADAEHPLADTAVAATRGLVLTFAGRPVSAPYFSSCGGTTAAASEVWRSPDEPYLVSVSDRIPGTDRHYCDVSSSFTWSRAFDRDQLTRTVARYLATYATVPSGGPGAVRRLDVDGHTASGRVRALVVTTDRGRFVLRGNDMRFVLRGSGGEILNSTYFSVDAVTGPGARLERVTLRGRGNGHGVGMCQWGAIGRARAGQDARAILQTYYPGTDVNAVEW